MAVTCVGCISPQQTPHSTKSTLPQSLLSCTVAVSANLLCAERAAMLSM